MAVHIQTVSVAIVAAVIFIIKYLNRTDTPKVKNLPEIPGVPLFGNLLQFGSTHAQVAAKFAKQYGPVFQVRLGNRVRKYFSREVQLCLDSIISSNDVVQLMF